MTVPGPPRRRFFGWKIALIGAVLGGMTLFFSWPNPERDIRQAVIAALRDELTPTMIDLALDDGDVDGAELLADAADLAGIALPTPTAHRLKAENSLFSQTIRKTGDCVSGATTGHAAGVAGIACSVAADLTLVGDVRDATWELTKPLNGEEIDTLVLGLAVAGIALEVAAPATGGTSLAAKVGTSVLKVTAKSRMIARRLADEISAILSSAVRLGPVKALSGDDLADTPRLRHAMGEAVDLNRLTPLTDAGKSLARTYRNADVLSAVMVVRTARSLDDVKTAEKLVQVFGKRTAGILKALGAKAFDVVLAASRMVGSALGILFGLFCWLVTSLVTLAAMIRLILRPFRRRAASGATT